MFIDTVVMGTTHHDVFTALLFLLVGGGAIGSWTASNGEATTGEPLVGDWVFPGNIMSEQ